MASSRGTGRKRGPKGKGVRSPITSRVPTEHKAHYEAEAARLGLTCSDYVALRLAQVHQLPVPAHLLPKQDQQLPIGA